MPLWYWILTATLGFAASLLYAASKAYGRAWPSALLFYLALVLTPWCVLLAAIGGVVWLVT